MVEKRIQGLRRVLLGREKLAIQVEVCKVLTEGSRHCLHMQRRGT